MPFLTFFCSFSLKNNILCNSFSFFYFFSVKAYLYLNFNKKSHLISFIILLLFVATFTNYQVTRIEFGQQIIWYYLKWKRTHWIQYNTIQSITLKGSTAIKEIRGTVSLCIGSNSFKCERQERRIANDYGHKYSLH